MLKQLSAIGLSFCLLLGITACSQQNGGKPQSGLSAPTISEQFLKDNSDEELLSIVRLADTTQLHPCNELREGFGSTADLSSDDLYNFFLNVLEDDDKGMERCYNSVDQNYHIPVQTVIDTLNQYFGGYQFDPAQVTLLDSYHPEENAFVQPGVVGFGRSGPSWLEIASKEAVSDDMVELIVNSYDRTVVENSDKIAVRSTLQLKITADGYRLISDTWDRTGA